MKRTIVCCAVAVLVSSAAFAQQGRQQQMPQTQQRPQQQSMEKMHEKMGPWTRKPKNEKQTRQEITRFLNQEDELMKKGDFDAMLVRIDFPIYMATDDSKGVPMAQEYSRQEYVSMMRPMFEQMPKDMKVQHRPTITVLSDSMAAVTDDFTVTMGNRKYDGRNVALLVKRNGEWKWKMVAEPGWGDAEQQMGTGGSPPPGQQRQQGQQGGNRR